ncbi:UbiH/UbiF family hydroxylase [Aureimonas sp. ME7]|uniref:UbiH/UbiF family hydroxylase n=1 Tax=Aureimonas sp. ME7 TaxID=2744252 RepID=UPI0015F8B4B0|nr:UbiH/UbiF family hydroxylase [Aureimonas sp. ME7]
METSRYEVAVVGGGLTGSIAALAFAEAGFDTLHLAPKASTDGRSTALFGRSLKLLGRLGVLDRLSGLEQPMFAMRLIDDTRRLLRAPPIEFRASEVGLPSFGINALNADLLAAIAQQGSDFSQHLTVVRMALSDIGIQGDRATIETEDGRRFACRLLVGSDGRASKVREKAGITTRSWAYPQTAIVLNFRHERDHHGVSTEFHTPSGPFTQVPLSGHRSSLVWVETPAEAARLVALPADDLGVEIEKRLHSILGKVTIDSKVQTFPLSGSTANRLTADRTALVGEAAHVFPPIGAQGLNLGLRDVDDLIEAAIQNRDDPGGSRMLNAYERSRSVDVRSRSLAVDLLNRSLLTSMLPVQAIRALGLGALGRWPALRHTIMREGVEPGSALRSALSRLRPALPERRSSR